MNKEKLLKMITILILLIVPLLASCGGDDGGNYEHEHEQTNPNEIEFSETNAFIRRTTAYTNTAQIGRRTYLFREDDAVVNTQFINTVESIIDRLGDFIEIPYVKESLGLFTPVAQTTQQSISDGDLVEFLTDFPNERITLDMTNRTAVILVEQQPINFIFDHISDFICCNDFEIYKEYIYDAKAFVLGRVNIKLQCAFSVVYSATRRR